MSPSAQRELLSMLRLVDAGKLSVNNKTQRPPAATLRRSRRCSTTANTPNVPVDHEWCGDENGGDRTTRLLR